MPRKRLVPDRSGRVVRIAGPAGLTVRCEPFRPSCGSGDRSARETSMRTRRNLAGRFVGAMAALAVVSFGTPLHAQTPFVPYFGKNQIRYDTFRWHIYTDRSFRDLLLSRDRAASRTGRQLRRKRVPADQRGPEARSRLQSPAHRLQDEQRVPGAERRARRRAGRRRRVRGAVPRPDGAADRRAPGPALPAHRPRAHAHLRVRHHPAGPDSPERAPVGERRPLRLHDRRVAADRSDDDPRRRRLRHRAEDDGSRRLRRVQQPSPHLQPGPRRLRVHRVEVGQGRPAAVPLLAAQERHRRRRRRLRRGVPPQARGVRPAVREVPEGPLQAVPRQGTARRLRAQPRAQPSADEVHDRALGRALPFG